MTELSAALEPLFGDPRPLGAAFRAVMAGAPVLGGRLREVLARVTEGTAERLAALASLGVPKGPLAE